jgi:putative transposase
MENYRKSSHSRFDFKYYFEWVTKYGKRDLVREICRTEKIGILSGAVSDDHVHVLLSCPPNHSLSKITQLIKRKSSHKLMLEFKHIQRMCWSRHFWARGYFAVSCGNMTDEITKKYIQNQEGIDLSDGGDNFPITH